MKAVDLLTGGRSLGGGAADGRRSPSSPRPGRSAATREGRWGLLFVAPWIVGFLAFYLLPLLASAAMSLTNYDLLGNEDEPLRFVGLDNWRRLGTDPEVAQGVLVTARFALLFIPLSIAVPLFFAYLLTARRLWARSFFRVMFFLPTMVPFVSALFIWSGYLNNQTGWLNRLLGAVGIDGPDWLRSPTWILPSLALIAMWGVGNAMIIFIAALNGVPVSLYEAARIDGAGPWALFRHVTWPMISPITFYNAVIALVALGQYFLVPFALTGGSGDPDNSALFYTMYFYRQTFKFFNGGYGATLAWAMLLVVLTLTAGLFRSARYWVHYEFGRN